jgi:uncharacterized SAM-binding protein YcdF (DUF218 family)
MNFNSPIVWTFLPTGLALDLANSIDKKLLVYYCIADFEKLSPHPAKIRKTERAIAQKADLIFVQGEEFKRRLSRYNSNVSIFPFGVNMDVFRRNIFSGERPSELAGIKTPIIGYIGGLHRHVDFKLLDFLAQVNPDWSFVFVGPIQAGVQEIKNSHNIFMLNIKGHTELAKYMDSFNVCLIPYILSGYTRTVYPTKLNEYLAMGKAVVSTPLPEVLAFNKKYGNLVYIGSAPEEFNNSVKKALGEDSPYLKNRRIEVAKENNWKNRIEDMSALMDAEIKRKQADREIRWSEYLSSFYKKAQKKVFHSVLICVLAWLILFKTPLLWFLASPLMISQHPQKSDVIVVFGGGVGETGSPGKSTIERARYAAQLYKEGYADKIIFSSGYSYIYNDAENMRLIALSAGVLDKDIILEQGANNTYENVIFSKKILDRYKWDLVLLITSPYNTRRTQLIFNKSGGGIKVFYTPVKNSQFYDRNLGVRPEQIKAIAHEYMGILYYWFKGYI